MNLALAVLPETNSFFIFFGYSPRSFAINHLNVTSGRAITSNHELMIGSSIAQALHKEVGDTIELSGVRYKIVGLYESTTNWEEMGGVVTLRDSQAIAGRPRKVMVYLIKLKDPRQAQAIIDRINAEFDGVSAALSGEFVEQMPDMQSSDAMIGGISFIAILVGGIGVLNTMLMSVFERTREIGVLRSLGWRRRRILGMILQEAVLLGLIGGLASIAIAFGLSFLLANAPMVGVYLAPAWEADIFARAIGVALSLGVLGGLYPAFRATRLPPIEALRYE